MEHRVRSIRSGQGDTSGLHRPEQHVKRKRLQPGPYSLHPIYAEPYCVQLADLMGGRSLLSRYKRNFLPWWPEFSRHPRNRSGDNQFFERAGLRGICLLNSSATCGGGSLAGCLLEGVLPMG